MVKQGYKQTEIGVIPEDWEVKELIEVGMIGSSKRIFESDYVDYGVPFYRGKEISLLIENKAIDEPYYISEEKFKSLLSKYGAPQKDDLLITAVGTLGNIYHVNNNRQFYFKDGNLIWIRKIDGNSKFIKIALDYHKNQILENANGSSQKALTIKSLSITKIPLPPLPEQEAIAEALSDADAWIASLEQLIAKKRLIKQGAMQELLTPPSTSSGNADGEALEPWEVKKLGEVAYVTGAGVDKKIVEGEKPVVLLNYLDVYRRDYIYGEELWHEVTAPANKVEQCDIKQGDVLITPSSELANDIGITALAMEDMYNVVYSYHLYRIRFFEELHWKFKLYLFKNRLFLNQAEKFAEGSGKRYVISLSKIREFDIAYPKSLFEQERIATILSDMDAELEALEQKLSKARQIKQGMMQELLTGKTRLIDN